MTASRPSSFRRVLPWVVGPSLASAVACGDDGGLPPLRGDGATATGSGGSRSAASGAGGQGGTSDPGGQGGETSASSGGEGGVGVGASAGGQGGPGSGDDGFGGVPGGPPVIPLCDDDLELGDVIRLEVSTAADDLLGSVTPDERAIAWVVVDASTVTMHYASRAEADEPFEAASTLVIDAAPDSVALSYDGLRAVFVDADRKGFSTVTRSSIEEAFGEPAKTDFELFEAEDTGLPADETYGDPVLAPTDLSFYFSRFGGGRTMTLFASHRFSVLDFWPQAGAVPVSSALEGDGDDRLRPTGISDDRQTLFLWNDTEQTELAATANPMTGRFEAPTNLGELRGATPNADCTRIYYSAAGDDDESVELYVGELE
jgi:hypothetical protein